MLIHANDTSLPLALRNAFAKVQFLIVRHYDDGSEWSYCVAAHQNADELATKERKSIGTFDKVGNRTLTSIEVRKA